MENYLRPRLEILVDLGLVGRKPGQRGDFPWIVIPATENLAREWRLLVSRTSPVHAYLDRQFFGSMMSVMNVAHRRVTDGDETLLWFARAVRWVARDIGFTPGRTGALLACLLAWEAGAIVEVDDVYDAVYGSAGSRWSSYLHFSGGSRFDKEFLVKVDDALVPELEKHVEPVSRPG
jgi:hypothetical protein